MKSRGALNDRKPLTFRLQAANMDLLPVSNLCELPLQISTMLIIDRAKAASTRGSACSVAVPRLTTSWENVAVVPGGRAGLIRIAAVLNEAYLGFFIPDYTAYNVGCYCVYQNNP